MLLVIFCLVWTNNQLVTKIGREIPLLNRFFVITPEETQHALFSFFRTKTVNHFKCCHIVYPFNFQDDSFKEGLPELAIASILRDVLRAILHLHSQVVYVRSADKLQQRFILNRKPHLTTTKHCYVETDSVNIRITFLRRNHFFLVNDTLVGKKYCFLSKTSQYQLLWSWNRICMIVYMIFDVKLNFFYNIF